MLHVTIMTFLSHCVNSVIRCPLSSLIVLILGIMHKLAADLTDPGIACVVWIYCSDRFLPETTQEPRHDDSAAAESLAYPLMLS